MGALAVPTEVERSGWSRALTRRGRRFGRHRLALIAGVALSAGWVATAIGLPLVLPMDPVAQDLDDTLRAPIQSVEHVFGTDPLGRDVLARLVIGARVSLLIGWLSVFFGAAVGLLLGVLAAHGGWLDHLVMRVAEAKLAFPFVLLVLLVMTAMIPGPGAIIAVLAFVGWPVYAKVIRGVALSLREEEFILAAQALGASTWRVMGRHLLPNVLPFLFVVMPLQLSQVVFAEAGLSFIGVGVQPPHPSWGAMLAESRNYMTTAWWLPVLPGLALLLAVLGANLLGDGLQDVFDPERAVATE